jgi:hypothetical protein
LIVLDQMVEVWFDIAHLVTPGLYPDPHKAECWMGRLEPARPRFVLTPCRTLRFPLRQQPGRAARRFRPGSPDCSPVLGRSDPSGSRNRCY